MQPVKIEIQGNFFDSQIYRDRLYLWHFDGRLSVYDWKQLIYIISTSEYLSYVKELCFLDGSYLYHNEWFGRLLQDNEINNLLIDKITNLSGMNFEVTEEELADVVIKEYDVPLHEMPLDTHIYNGNLYYTIDNGQYVSKIQSRKDPLSAMKRPSRIFDGRVVHMSASAGRMTMSMLSDGLCERIVSGNFASYEVKRITDKHSNFAHYNYSNIFNSSLIGDSFLIYNPKEDNKVDSLYSFAHKEINRQNASYIYEDDIIKIKKGGLGWGFNDRIYYSSGKSVSAIHFAGYDKDDMFQVLKDDMFIKEAPDDTIVNAAVAYFGNIIEYMSKLVVLQSDNDVLEIGGPITRWRVFPRSLNYENQLHVILDDSICIYGFMHDYAANSWEKVMGSYYQSRPNRNQKKI